MHLVTRLSSSMALVGLVVFGCYGAWLYREEREDLHRAVDREVGFLTTSLRVGIENALRDNQTEDVLETIARLEGVDTEVEILVLRPDGSPWVVMPGSRLDSGSALLERIISDVELSKSDISIREPEGLPGELVYASPLFADDRTIMGILMVLRPLTDVEEDLGDTLGLIILSVGVFILLATFLGTLVGRAFLVNPLNRLLIGIRKVRSSEESSILPETGDVEVSELAIEFNQMTRDLAAARERLAQESEARRSAQHALQAADRLVTVGQLSAAFAHEIGSPLQVLHGRARALLERSSDPERVRASAEIMVRETDRITRIVSQVLSVARRKKPSKVIFDLAEVLLRVVGVMEIEARRGRVSLKTEASSSRIPVEGDPDHFQQVILNLLVNALQATAPGGRILVRAYRTADQAVLEVEDTGEGMDEETLSSAFEALFTTRAEQGGTGLGLAVVKSIVEEHRGTVSCRSERGQGSVFSVHVPVASSLEVTP